MEHALADAEVGLVAFDRAPIVQWLKDKFRKNDVPRLSYSKPLA